MGMFDIWKPGPARRPVVLNRGNQAIKQVATAISMQFRHLPDNQVIWDVSNSSEALDKGFLKNHAIFTIANWKASKIASAPPILYEVRDKKELKKYKALMAKPTPESLQHAQVIKSRALVEIENDTIMKVFEQPNPLMGWYEFAYGTSIYKDFVGSSFWSAVRDGSVNDATKGRIRQMYLPQANLMKIFSGGYAEPVQSYFLSTNPEVKIPAANVKQIRNFSPRWETETQFLYGLSKLHAARDIVDKYNESVTIGKDLFKKKGIQDVVFLKNLPEGSEYPTIEQVTETRDAWNEKLMRAETGGVLFNPSEVGSIRIGMSPSELGILEDQKVTKNDYCALWHIPSIIFGWSDQTTYNNLAESRKIGLTDAVIPELEQMADALNSWYLPSHVDSGKYQIGFDYQYFPELQDDFKDTVKWMNEANCLTTNERRVALKYGESQQENSNEIMVDGRLKRLQDVGVESFEGDLDSVDIYEEDKDDK